LDSFFFFFFREKKKAVEEATKARSEFEKEVAVMRKKTIELRGKISTKGNQIANVRSKKEAAERRVNEILVLFSQSQAW
jgi:septal ring factor EnvC (AmiA/AmiB activator)